MSNVQKQSYIYALIAVLLWSTVASAFKLSLRFLTVTELVLISTASSVIALFLIVWLTGKLSAIRSFTRQDILLAAFFGFLNPFLYYHILFKAYDLLPAQQAQAINYTWAITLALVSVPVLKQPLSRYDVIGLVIAYFGVLIISTQGDLASFEKTNIKGVGYALLSTLIWALYWVYNTRENKPIMISLLLSFSFGLVFILIYYLTTAEIREIHSNGYFGAIYIGLFEMSLTFLLWLSALKLSDSTAKISTLIFLSPFLSLIFIHYFIGENIQITTFIGLVVIVSGVLIQRKKSKES